MHALSRLRSRPALTSSVVAGLALAATSVASIAAQSGEPVIRKTYAESRPGAAPTLPVAKGAPNVIWILLDDVGFGATSAFGGPARTPVIEQRAYNGLRYTNFHTTAVCSATSSRC